MRLTIIQGGQTGVDRGAWLGAAEYGLARSGWMPDDRRDERGPIPPGVQADLQPLDGGGLSARTGRNVQVSNAVLILVEDPHRGIVSPGSRLTFKLARGYHVPWLVAGDGDRNRILDWLHRNETQRMDPVFSLMIAGPRASVWPDGECVARGVVVAIAKGLVGSWRDMLRSTSTAQ